MIIFDNAFLEKLKDAIVKSNINKSLIANLKDISSSSSNPDSNKNKNSNSINNTDSFSSNLDALSSNNNDIEQFLFSIIPLVEKYIQNEITRKVQDTTENTSFSKDSNNHSGSGKVVTDLVQNKDNIVENTLIISEIHQNVILPYYVSDLEEISSYNNNMAFDEIIKQKYTLPISMFKSLAFSRFREAFKLARNKEKKSLKFSFDLGLELLFNYNLHPAIIAACRNLDELDIYLDCLDSGETDKFQCFNIKFEVPPVVIKK